jgi:hypothetical protein
MGGPEMAPILGMGGPDMAPHTPQRSARHGSAGARLDTARLDNGRLDNPLIS